MNSTFSRPIKGLLFGAGDRGFNAYGRFAGEHPDQFQFTAVAEPQAERRQQFARVHNIPAERCFESWEQALAAPKTADVVVNCTQDRLHYASGTAALAAGYDMLLEKPIASTLAESVGLVRSAEEHKRLLMVGHVLRYTEFFEKVKEILASGRLGQLVTVSWRENVGAFHMAHSYVRGNWRSSTESAPMILAKCCHDLDLLSWFLEEPVRQLSSAGNLRHFRPEHAPEGAPARCTDGCPAEKSCPFYAPDIYLHNLWFKHSIARSDLPVLRGFGRLLIQRPALARAAAAVWPPLRAAVDYHGWPRSTITDHPEDDQAVLLALREGPYGRCVYHCDNDVVDHQVVLMTSASGVSVSLTMHGHSYEEGRTLRFDGSQATLLGKFSLAQNWIEIWDQRGFLLERVRFTGELEQNKSGHGGGDAGLMRAFIRMLQGQPDPLTGGRNALESHLLAFASEEARLKNKLVLMDDYRARAG